MTLFSIATKNVRQNMSSYFLYSASMIFSICIYFIFVTLKYSDTIEQQIDSSQKIGSLMNGASVILLFFVAIFIFYCNSFFMKKRKKEIGLYALLGLRKRQIGNMLFFENLLLGMIALVAGIFIGFIASKGILTLLIHLMGYDVVAPFTFSMAAVVHTAIVFLLLFFITSLQGARIVYRFQLIELFHASSKGEGVPKANPIVAAIGVGLIAIGYFLALQDLLTSEIWRKIGFMLTPIIILGTVVVGTYLLFHSLTGTVLQMMKKSNNWAWKGLRIVTISQLLYRVRAQAKTLSVIAILSATTITAGGAVYGLYYNTTSDVEKIDPNTYMFVQTKEQQKKIDNVVGTTQFDAVVPAVSTRINVKNNDYDMEYTVISLSTYNRLANVQQKPKIVLKNDSAVVLDATYDERYSIDYKQQEIPLQHKAITLSKVEKYNVLNTALAYVTVVVSDDNYEALAKKNDVVDYRVIKQEEDTLEQAKAIAAIIGEAPFSSQTIDLRSSMESIGVLLFIGSFLGLVFLAATGSIIYFKVLTELEEDRAKYVMMHKLGVPFKMMRRSLMAQQAIVFVIPLIVALLHSVIALKAFSSLLGMNLIVPVCIWMAVYTILYGIYYAVTVYSSSRTIKQTIRVEEA